MTSEEDTRPWSELSEEEQEQVIAATAYPPASTERIEVERVPADQWAPTLGEDEPTDDHVEGVDAERGGEHR